MLDGPLEDTRTMAARAIADDGELKLVWMIIEAQMVPWVSFLGLDAQLAARRDRIGAGHGGGSRQRSRDENANEKPFHRLPLLVIDIAKVVPPGQAGAHPAGGNIALPNYRGPFALSKEMRE
ncbi:MAG TPA: hypothetical protein VKI65_14360 [Gemmataceae bacterium]|nr:hypothetical protein [Gemmataceae bacterium]